MPPLALREPRSVWRACKPRASVSLACRWPLGLCAVQGQRRLKLVSACWSELAQAGQWDGGVRDVCGERGGGQSAALAFTGSPRIAKFFSNLQLLDVGANHQRGSPPCLSALPPYAPPPYPHTDSPTSPPLPSYPPPECRLIQASSLIHVFIYYFIGCAWAGERRLLLVRTVINSLKPLPPFFLYPSLSLAPHHHPLSTVSIAEDTFTSCSCAPTTPVLPSRFICIPPLHALFLPLHSQSNNLLHHFPSLSLFLPYLLIHWRTRAHVCPKRLRRDKRDFPSDRADLQISNYP